MGPVAIRRRGFAAVSAILGILYLLLLAVEHQEIGRLEARRSQTARSASRELRHETGNRNDTVFFGSGSLRKHPISAAEGRAKPHTNGTPSTEDHVVAEEPWVAFGEDPSTHNQTIDGSELPGLFWEKRLWLLGARLTTSYEEDDDRVFLTVFGMPGDFFARTKSHRVRCPPNEWYNGDNGTVWSYPRARQEAQLFVGCAGDHPLLPLEFLRTVSGDTNQNNNTLVWHGDLGRAGITMGAVRQRLSPGGALRLSLFAAAAGDPEPSRILTVDLPLSTGVVGQAGPQHTAPGQSSLLASNPMDAALCVAVYGERSLEHLPEFVVHHTNLGFGQVIVGIVDGLPGSASVERAAIVLHDFVESGTVSIAAAGMDLLECEVNVRKEHFYNACLYHAKGIAEYVGIWDIDEYWLPPLSSEWTTSSHSTAANPTTDAIQTKTVSFRSVLENSTYKQVPGVGTVMAAIQNYHERTGCGESWCYHSFPSWTAWLRRNATGALSPRTGRIGDDFGLRQNEIDWAWSKSISRTKYTYMGGLHQTGSCRFQHTPPGNFQTRWQVSWKRGHYQKLRDGATHGSMPNASGTTNDECWNLIMPDFGMMHHFYSLNRVRSIEKTEFLKICAGMEEDDNDNEDDDDGSNIAARGCSVDEYVEYFAPTVKRQLDARRISSYTAS